MYSVNDFDFTFLRIIMCNEKYSSDHIIVRKCMRKNTQCNIYICLHEYENIGRCLIMHLKTIYYKK